jgi:hypothetical protein
MEGKNSFILYIDLIHTVKKLSNEKAGELFKIILEYVNDNDPIIDDNVLDIVFEPIKQLLKRDLKKWENICERNKINGLKGGRPKNPDEPNKPNGLIGNPKNPVKPDSDNDIDNDSEYSFNAFWDLYNKKIDRSKSLIKWNKIKQTDKDKIFKHIPNYIKSQPEIKYRKNPLTYLNGECWNDEIQLKPTKDKFVVW